MLELKVDLGERSYPIYIGSGLLSKSDLVVRHVSGNQVLIVTNETIAPLYLEPLRDACHNSGRISGLSELVLPDGEAYKNLDTLNLVFDKLLADRHNRSTTIVALGGGVVGDMSGFAAACYQRGVRFIQVPTSLLAQVDSSVGGKTGVNHPLGKNMIGAFHQPEAVVIDTDTLKTLPPRELRAGMAEVIKYGIIKDSQFFAWLENNYQALLALDEAALSYAIERSCAIKAQVVAQDERESGVRAILNLGHTFGHAIEAATGYGNWLHGEAVAAGMVIAADLSMRQGWLAREDARRIRNLIEATGLPVAPPAQMGQPEFERYMAVDKKVIDGKLRLVLIKRLGEAVVSSDFTADLLRQTLVAREKLCDD